jgi:hypothetical protein
MVAQGARIRAFQRQGQLLAAGTPEFAWYSASTEDIARRGRPRLREDQSAAARSAQARRWPPSLAAAVPLLKVSSKLVLEYQFR